MTRAPRSRTRRPAGPDASAGTVVLVATPIGNLGDLPPRALDTLAGADLVCCEDTRRTRALLSYGGVTGKRLVSLHGHNEHERLGEVLARLAEGATVAVVSDAGTPAVSDPGGRLVRAALDAGASVTTVPGPSAAVAALVVSGLPSARFCFEGFLPRRGADRRKRLDALAANDATVVLFEAPRRLPATLADLAAACGPDRPVAVARELTKLHEEVWRGTLGSAADEYGGREVQGEVVVVVGGAPGGEVGPGDDEVAEALRRRLRAGDSRRDAAAEVARSLGVSRRRAYDAALSVSPPAPASGRNAGTTGGVGGRGTAP